MIDPKLTYMIENGPGVIRNSILIRIVRYLFFPLGILLFILGASMLIDSFIGLKLADFILLEDIAKSHVDYQKQVIWLLQIIGAAALILGFLFVFIAWLSKKILERNRHIFQLWIWHQEQLEKESEKQIKSPV